MISDEDLQDIASVDDWYMGVHLGDMAKELLAHSEAANCQHQWNELKLVECGGRYQYYTLCGAKRVAE